jgi:hypothetical protein
MGSKAIWFKEVKQLRKSVREIFCGAELKHFLHLWVPEGPFWALAPKGADVQ